MFSSHVRSWSLPRILNETLGAMITSVTIREVGAGGVGGRVIEGYEKIVKGPVGAPAGALTAGVTRATKGLVWSVGLGEE